MASLDTALTSSLSSLRVNQEGLALVSQNIANANSDNYTRRIVEQTNEVVDGRVSGAKIAAVKRSVDNFLVEAARAQSAHVGKAAAMDEFLARGQLFYGEPGAETSLDSFVNNFFADMANLASTPDQTTRTRAMQSAVKLAERLSGMAGDIEQLRFDIDQEISSTLNNLNQLLGQAADINIAIQEASLNGTDKNALFDERDHLLKQITEIIDVSVNFDVDGAATLFVARGELLSPIQRFQLEYPPITSVDSLINGSPIAPIEIVLLDDNGLPTESRTTLISASNADPREINFTSGRLMGLVELRDTELPKTLEQLDEFARTLADEFNAIHNDGAGFPPPSELTGTRQLFAEQQHFFSGDIRIAVLNADGSPVLDPFDSSEMPPLTIDLDRLDGGNGQGSASIQDIINEINSYYGPPPANKVAMGPLDNIQVASLSDSIASTKASAAITFSGSNPGVGDTVTVNGTVFTFKDDGLESNGTSIEIQDTLAATVNEIASYLNSVSNPAVSAATYSTTGNQITVTHDTAGTAPNGVFGLSADVTNGGGTVSVNGGPAGATASGFMAGGVDANGLFEFDFEFSNISGKDATFEITGALSFSDGAVSEIGSFNPFTSTAGLRERTGVDGVPDDTITLDLSGSSLGEGDILTVSVPVRVTDGDGNIYNDTIDFEITIPDPDDRITNQRFPATALSGSGDGDIANVVNNSRFATALLVDANGNPVAEGEPGFLQIRTDQASMGIVIDELDSSEGGLITDPLNTVTNRGLSHFFGLNDFFHAGDELNNSAVNFSVRNGYDTDPARLSTGELVLSPQPSGAGVNPAYTYEVGPSSNQIAGRLANLAEARTAFDGAGTLPALSLTFSNYSAEIISFAAFQAGDAENALKQEELLFSAFDDRLKSTGGVNVDEELANTINFQNNYQASARMINVIAELFESLINVF